MVELAVQLEGVHKFYGKVHALRGLDLGVEKGEVFGFLGPNGAGKTTTIRCMLDLIRPNQGMIRVLGMDPQSSPQAVKAKVGYLPGDLQLEGDFTPRDFFRFIRKLRKDLRPWNDLLALADRVDLALDVKIKTLSQGNKQKVGLIQSFVSDVPLLMLDEPTLGLDPLMKQEVLNIIREESERLQASMDAMRQIYIANAQMAATAMGPNVERKIDEIVKGQRRAEDAIASFVTSRTSPDAASSRPLATPAPRPATPTPMIQEQPALALQAPAEAAGDPVTIGEFISAMNFPETATDRERED